MKDEYSKHYSEKGLWEKIKKYGKTIGKELIEKCLILYYVGIDPHTPKWAKGVVATTLGYMIWPIDAIPDLTPMIGYADDAGAIVAALAAIAVCITDKHIADAKEKLSKWFD